MKKSRLIIISKTLMITLVTLILVMGAYVAYVSIQYHRLDDELVLNVHNNNSQIVDVNNEYVIMTYNIGFGAYNHDFSFFMDTGEMLSGEKMKGTKAKAEDKRVVENNTNGAIELVKTVEPDFLFLQEVDVAANRSYFVDQYALFSQALPALARVMALNFHSAYLFYPLNDPIGKITSGMTTFSQYGINEATRYQLPIDNSFPTRFFDLDRCFVITRIKTNTERDLVLINVHLSAYDEGGAIRALQLKKLQEILIAEQNHYVIVGGDFNHDIADSLHSFTTTQKVPTWVYVFPKDSLPNGYHIVAANNVGTCRSTDMAYTKNVNYTVVIDGFIVNDLISVIDIHNIDNDFFYSDHNPVAMTFSFGD